MDVVYDVDGPSILQHYIAREYVCISWGQMHLLMQCNAVSDEEKKWLQAAGIDANKVHYITNLKDASTILLPITLQSTHFVCVHDENWLASSTLTKTVEIREVKSIVKARYDLLRSLQMLDSCILHFDASSRWPLLKQLFPLRFVPHISTDIQEKKDKT
jgi:hypothetical protein